MGSISPRAHQSRWNSRQTAQSPLPQPAGTSRSHSCQSPPQHLATSQALLSTPRHPKRTSALAGWPLCGSCWPSVCSCPRVLCCWLCAAWGGRRSRQVRRTTSVTGTTPSPWTTSAGTPWSCPERYTLWRVRIMTPVYPLMETTAAAAWSWLTLSARRPSSSTETKLLPYRDTEGREAVRILVLLSPCCSCLFYICGKYSETLTLYCISQTQRATWKKSGVNRRLFTTRMHLRIFLMYIFYKRLNCDKGFYCLYKITEYMWFCFFAVAWWWVHCGCCHTKSALERDTCAIKKIQAVLCNFNFPLKSIPEYL